MRDIFTILLQALLVETREGGSEWYLLLLKNRDGRKHGY